ncbi:hypothetical protein VTK73DRAFT_4883 [Phialemonium thermophilum]|uniref:Uncharacterized protein n=1 Tax=Phialemonium thermophilum TaxID=223376 RepID=A0ABR3V565_9PEZI
MELVGRWSWAPLGRTTDSCRDRTGDRLPPPGLYLEDSAIFNTAQSVAGFSGAARQQQQQQPRRCLHWGESKRYGKQGF